MLRTLKIALFSATMMVAACKKADKPAESKPEDTKATEPAKPATAAPADPSAKPTDPAAKPADPAVKPADPAAGAGQNSALETRGVALMQQMGDLFAANPKDCEKLAVGLRAFVAKNKPLLQELTAYEKAQPEGEKAAFEARNRGVQEEVMKKMQPAMEACQDNKSVEAAMKEFPTD